MRFLDFMWTNRADVWRLTLEHMAMVAVAILLATAIGIPLGILMTRNPRLSRPILAVANIVQTIPSLALFGFLIPLPFERNNRRVLADADSAKYADRHSQRGPRRA